MHGQPSRDLRKAKLGPSMKRRKKKCPPVPCETSLTYCLHLSARVRCVTVSLMRLEQGTEYY
jgi:hypothetical protein